MNKKKFVNENGPCWDGYKQVGMKMKSGREVPNCVPESVEINEENEPTNPALWSRAKAAAKAKYDVYPSAYANAFASKWYKEKGGSWKTKSESISERFDKTHLDMLKQAYSNINKINPNSAEYNRLVTMLDKLSKDELKQIADADIKFLSLLAKNRLMRNEQKIHNVKEGNAFTGALYQARQEGKTEFEFNGKTYPVKEANTETIEEVIKMKKSMNERISPKDMDAIKSAVQSASSFMSVGSELKKLGMRYIFATSPMPVYIVQDKSGNRVGIVNKKYATKPDFVVGDIAVGIMESKSSVNEADVVGKTVFSDGKGKLHFGYYKTDDAVEFVDYKTWKKLSFKDVSKGDTNKDRVINAILRNQKQFNKKVDYNMWAKKTNPSFEQKMDWFIQNGWISNINKGGIKESVNPVKENASRTAMEIGGLTGLNKDAIQKFVDTHNMDIEKVFQYVKKGKLTDRLNFVTAIVGTPGNPVEKRMIKMFGESVNEAKYPTDLKIGSVILGQGFTMLKGIEGGRYYKIVDMDDFSATLVPSDKNGNVKGSKKVRHKLDSIEGGIKTAKRGDENGIVVIKESVKKSLNEDMSTAFLLIAQAAVVNGFLIAQMATSDGGDFRFRPIANLKAWWNKRKSDKALKSIIAKIKNDKDVVEFMKLTPAQQRGKFRSLIATKLSGEELEYLNKINRTHFKNESVNEAKAGDFEMGDFVHFKSANKTGMVKKISGDMVTIMTMKGEFTGNIKDVKVLYQDEVNPSVNEAAMSDIDIIAQEAKDFKDFLKEFYKEYKDFPKTKESLKWLAGVYKNRSKTEGLETDEN
jgi:hypothetical protein